MGIEIPDKECGGDCRFVVKTEMTTCMYFQPIYDKNGDNINPDGNTTSGEMVCPVCNRKWFYKKQYGEYSYEEIKPKDLTFSENTGTINTIEIAEGC